MGRNPSVNDYDFYQDLLSRISIQLYVAAFYMAHWFPVLGIAWTT